MLIQLTAIYVSEVVRLHTLNLHSATCQIYFNKLKEKNAFDSELLTLEQEQCG